MAITLRTVTGSALSHTQLDTNFSSYFYSASVSASVLDLHYTGSATIGLLPRSTSINLPNSSKWTDVAGGGISRNSEVQITGSTNISGSGNIVGTLTQGFPGSQASNFGHAEGYFSIASGNFSHAEGYQSVTSGSYSHAEGRESITVGIGSHAEGYLAVASGSYSHAEGTQTVASGLAAHTEGARTIASGDYSHAEGVDTQAVGYGSHAEGLGTTAQGNYQHVQGQYNIGSSAQSAFIIGNGTADGARKNLVFASGSQFQISGSLNVSGAVNTIGDLTVQGNITAQQYIVSTSVYFVTESFLSGSHIFGNSLDDTHQFTGSVIISPDVFLPGSSSIYFGAKALGTTSSFAILRDSDGRLGIGNRVSSGGYGVDGIKIDTEGKVQLTHVIQNYGLYDTTLNIIGSGSNDGITMTQWPDTTNRYRITIQSGSQYKMNFRNSLHPSSGSFDFSGSVAITNDLFLGGNKQFNYGMFFHTASITVDNGISGSAQLSTTTTANGVSIVSGSRITVENPGYYNIQFSAQLSQGSNTANYSIWFKKNGTNIANSNSTKTLANNTNALMTVNIIDYASTAGDYYEIAHQSDQSNSSIAYIAASGNIPATPAVIVTVQQVR